MNRDKIGTQTCYVHQHNLVNPHRRVIVVSLCVSVCVCVSCVSVSKQVFSRAIATMHTKRGDMKIEHECLVQLTSRVERKDQNSVVEEKW